MPGDGVLAGRYRLGARLGKGGAGTVWQARDELLHRDVAVKQLHVPEHGRAIQEARAAATLRHPSVLLVHDVVVDEGQAWIVMDLSTGVSLDRSGPLPPEAVVRIGLQLTAALEDAHAHGVLHQDVKPANILLDADGTALLTDFGIAAHADAEHGSAGSPGYMAPERLNGQPSTPSSDFWSLGATLYTLAEGRAPFQHDHPAAVVAAVLMREPPFPSKAGRQLGGLIMDLLAKDPARRPSPADIRRRLTAPAPSRSRKWVLASAALVLVVGGGLYGLAVRGEPGTGRFATAPDPCGLLTDAQAATLLGGTAQRKAPRPDQCAWERVEKAAVARKLLVTVRAERPTQGKDAPEVAALLFAAERTAKDTAVPGVGEEAFLRDRDEWTWSVLFRSSNLIAEVAYEVRAGKAQDGPVVDAAEQVAGALAQRPD